MSLNRLELVTHIADRLNELAAMVKTRSRASLNDASHILETVCARFFNALFGWELINLNAERSNYPAADLGDFELRTSIQITNQESAEKIKQTARKAIQHELGKNFDRLIIFFLLAKKPAFPRRFAQPVEGPTIETWDIADLLNQLKEFPHLEPLARAAKALDEEMGKARPLWTPPPPDISRIVKFAPIELIGRETETQLLNDAWSSVQAEKWPRSHVITFVALGGEGKTSLVAKWAADLATQGWPGCNAVFAWSFYSQGTRDQVAANSDLFLKECLSFFGDDEMAKSSASAFDKGRRLAQLAGQRRALLILDGIEPLQYAPTSPTPGELKDQGLAVLLRMLATSSQGLCVITTRYALLDLRAYAGKTVHEEKLARLNRAAGVHLLKSFGVRGSERRNILLRDGDATSEQVNELEKLVEDVKGHALTLNLLGSYLHEFHAGDIRQRDRVQLGNADAESEHPDHAAHVLDAYVKALQYGGRTEEDNIKGRRALALLRLMGLFDRPATADCLAALWSDGAIEGLTDSLTGLSEGVRNRALQRLEDARLLTVNRAVATGELLSLDAHPLVREYFERHIRKEQPEAWRAAHRRLYEYLSTTAPFSTKTHGIMRIFAPGFDTNPTLEELQPLYQAVVHACYAGLHEEAWINIFRSRILREGRFYSYQKLGAVSSDLAALASFFEFKWSKVSSNVTETTRGRVLNAAGLRLRLLGRMSEALEAHQEAVKVKDQEDPITSLRNLSEVQLEIGDISSAVSSSSKCLSDAKMKEQSIMMRALYANALHQKGDQAKAHRYFRQAERNLKDEAAEWTLHSVYGFWYCDLLIAAAERTAWQRVLGIETSSVMGHGKVRVSESRNRSECCRACLEVGQRAAKTLKTALRHFGPLDAALDHLTLGRAALYKTILAGSNFARRIQGVPRSFKKIRAGLEASVSNLYKAGAMSEVPGALLTRAWLRFLEGRSIGSVSAQEDLDEAWEIAERGPMRLFMVDILLYRVRLFFREAVYPWKDAPDRSGIRKGNRSAKDDLADAEYWINRCGYHRRDGELADAKTALELS